MRHPASMPAGRSVGTGDPVEAPDPEPWRSRPFLLRPRVRAMVVVIAVGVPLLIVYSIAQLLPTVMWFQELRQGDVYARAATIRISFALLVAGPAALFLCGNLLTASPASAAARSRTGRAVLVAGSVLVAGLFGAAASGSWQTFALWLHQEPFEGMTRGQAGVVESFVFTLPFTLLASTLVMWLVLGTTVGVLVVYLVGGAGGQPRRVSARSRRRHLGLLAGLALLVVAWKLQIARDTVALNQPQGGVSFAGPTYVDEHVRSPALVALTIFVVLLAVGVVALPWRTSAAVTSRSRWIGRTATLLGLSVALAATLTPALVQRMVVDPNPLIAEQGNVARSIAATRAALGLDGIAVKPYVPSGAFTAADFPAANGRLDDVVTWDPWLLELRMRQLVTDTPYFGPERPSLDVLDVTGQPKVTVVSTRELDLTRVGASAEGWNSDRLAYTHGIGLIRFSGTEVGENREPQLLDDGLSDDATRIYFGNFRRMDRSADEDAVEQQRSDEATSEESTEATEPVVAQEPSWVLANTRRPEVDLPATSTSSAAPYHYAGDGGIQLATWKERAVFALALGSKDFLLSDDITPQSRILLHRDVHDRLETLAPFIQWDSRATPRTTGDHVLFVVDGYTTSANYPYAERTDLGDSSVSYARATVRATVDAYSGKVALYLTDPSEPIVRAWASIFPSLFLPASELPSELHGRIGYPFDLFSTQANAYERLHTTRTDLFISNADAWARPVSLSGPIEVAASVNFDESDEDDLRLTMRPEYTWGPPPGASGSALLLNTYYSPRSGQNLVGSLSGWIDGQGQPRLAARDLPRDSVTLGPAQMSRLVFATPRVSDLLGLKNLETRDLDTSSLDTVLLGRPHLLFLPTGIVQVQSLYEGSRGPGAARLLGVTAFVNGRAGLGPDVHSAIRQAINSPPTVRVTTPSEPVVVGRAVSLGYEVGNAVSEEVTITSRAGTLRKTFTVANGRGSVPWIPTVTGDTKVTITVHGQDGTQVTASAEFAVLSLPPTLRVPLRPIKAVVGEPVAIAFQVTNALDELARVSTRSGVVFERTYVVRDGDGLITWTPTEAGTADVLIRVRGREDQVTTKTLHLTVAESPKPAPPPSVRLVEVPDGLAAGLPASFSFDAGGCVDVVATVVGPADESSRWRFGCPSRGVPVAWTPRVEGTYVLTVTANGTDASTQVSVRLVVAGSS